MPSLPLSIYSTFVIEEKHGFNKMTPSLFVIDLLKGWAVAFVLGAPFLAAFLYIFKWAGDRFVPWLMAFMYSFISGQFSFGSLFIQDLIPVNYGHHLPDCHPAPFQQAFAPSGWRPPYTHRVTCD